MISGWTAKLVAAVRAAERGDRRLEVADGEVGGLDERDDRGQDAGEVVAAVGLLAPAVSARP